MVRLFERLEHCPATNRQVVLEGVTMPAEHPEIITGFLSCSNARRCEQDHGSLFEVPACRLHEVTATRTPPDKGEASSALSGEVAVRVDPDVAHLVPAFIHNRREEVKHLRIALIAQDFAAIDRLAQKMVGGGTMFGFPDITDLGRALRRSLAAGDLAGTKDAITRYATYLASLRLEAAEDAFPGVRAPRR